MDYHAIHGHDVLSFDLPSTHRLPTVSAAQALEHFEGNQNNFISTGLSSLDASLGSHFGEGAEGGIAKGHVTEIWGPPGSGKTTFGIQLAANCLRRGKGVVWVDGFHPVSIKRLRAIVSSDVDGDTETVSGQLEALAHYTCPSLAHLIALLCRPTESCIPQSTSLIVVDSLSALVNHAFPKAPDGRGPNNWKGTKGPPLSAQRLQFLQHVIGALQKLAATRDLAIAILTQCATKMQAERGATLVPAINATVWDQGISTRLVLFRDWLPEGTESRALRFVGVQKKNGKGVGGPMDITSAFTITTSGLIAADHGGTHPSRVLSTTPALKRKLADTNFEIADSEDEDYGWNDGDEDALPPMPSQWQGSEDILLRPEPGSGEEIQEEQEDDQGSDVNLGSEGGDPDRELENLESKS